MGWLHVESDGRTVGRDRARPGVRGYLRAAGRLGDAEAGPQTVSMETGGGCRQPPRASELRESLKSIERGDQASREPGMRVEGGVLPTAPQLASTCLSIGPGVMGLSHFSPKNMWAEAAGDLQRELGLFPQPQHHVSLKQHLSGDSSLTPPVPAAGITIAMGQETHGCWSRGGGGVPITLFGLLCMLR